MNRHKILIVAWPALLVLAAAGCQQGPPGETAAGDCPCHLPPAAGDSPCQHPPACCRDPFDQRATMNAWIVHSYTDPAIANGIVAQHTLFPYHFVADTAELNELGQRDMAVLADHYRDATGQLNVRRGDASEALYRARLAAVTTRLAGAGIPAGRVQLADGFAGGPGLPTDRCVVILGGDASKQVYPAGPSGPLTNSITGGLASGSSSNSASSSGSTGQSSSGSTP
jgi:hypothetical protein